MKRNQYSASALLSVVAPLGRLRGCMRLFLLWCRIAFAGACALHLRPCLLSSPWRLGLPLHCICICACLRLRLSLEMAVLWRCVALRCVALFWLALQLVMVIGSSLVALARSRL